MYLFALLNHFNFLIETSSQLLSSFDLFIASFVFDISNLFLKCKFIANEYIIKLFIFHW